MAVRVGVLTGVIVAMSGYVCSTAVAQTPGWECVPAKAGQAVTSGGTGSSPSCRSGSTAVLAPTYVSAGVGGKPTVLFSGVNVQIINGSGSEITIDGEGNLVIGYDPNPRTQTGSHNLVLGTGDQSYTSYGGIDAGVFNTLSGSDAAVLGIGNTASGSGSSVGGGYHNKTTGLYAAVGGGNGDVASGHYAFAAGGKNNTASGYQAAALGGNTDVAKGDTSMVTGGFFNTASGRGSWVSGGWSNTASGAGASVSGGLVNFASAPISAILGGDGNEATTSCSTFPTTGQSC